MSATSVSFRDPGGRTLVGPDRVLREVTPLGWKDLSDFLNSPLSRELEGERRIVSTKILSRTEPSTLVEHDKIFFPSYPYEWPPEMLAAAAGLTLDLAERSLDQGFGLKDATPYNVLFRATHPILVDILSFERRSPGDPMWLPYAQFVRNFLLPLLLDRRFGVPLKGTFLSNRDGISPESAYRMAGPLQKILPPVLTLATIPTLLGKVMGTHSGIYRTASLEPEKARFALSRLYRTLRRQLDHVQSQPDRESEWTSYEKTCPYTPGQTGQKLEFVKSVLERTRPVKVLDIGCNTGLFSKSASGLGADVVSIDSDSAVIGKLWKQASSLNENILPLAVDIARPSPAAGWRNLECESFLSRCKGQFDSVLMLGMIHHLLITERIPLDAIIDLGADLTKDSLVIEYVGPDDPMFDSLLRGRDQLYEAFNQHAFVRACARAFETVDTCALPNCGRVIYFLRKKIPA